MKAMNGRQQIALWIGIFVFVSMGVSPPWRSMYSGRAGEPLGYYPIFEPPTPNPA